MNYDMNTEEYLIRQEEDLEMEYEEYPDYPDDPEPPEINILDGMIRIYYLGIPIVSFNKEKIILRTRDTWTNEILLMMNQIADQYHLGITIHKARNEWYIRYNGETLPFDLETKEMRRKR